MTDTDALCCLHNVIYCMFACLHGPREMLLEMSGPRVPPMFFLHALKPIALLDQIQSVCFCAMVLVLSVQMNVFFLFDQVLKSASCFPADFLNTSLLSKVKLTSHDCAF